MSKVLHSIGRVFQSGAKAFSRFPAAMLSALAIAVIASILIQQDVTPNEKLYNSLQLACAFGAFLGLALAAAIAQRSGRIAPFVLINLLSLLLTGAVFAIIYLRSGDIPSITVARVIAASAIALLAFLLIISRDAYQTDYNQASFMTLKSALIALIYALAILLGLLFVAFTVETLLYNAMSEKVYEHIAVWSALGWFAFFLGYFPDFRRGREDPHQETAQKQPVFIEILFAYVLIPIMMIMTVVLVIWAIQILVVGKWPVFSQLTSIFSAFTLFGIFLSVMVSHHIKPIAILFRKIFPFTAILFLAFEGYAIVNQIRQSSIKINEYFVALIWIFVLISVVLMLIRPVVNNRLTAFLAILLIFTAVLPVAGYQDLPVSAQTSRLRMVLNKNDMLVGNKISPAPSSISKDDKVTITDATNFLLRYDDVPKAVWFSSSFTALASFQKVYGFEPAFSGTNGSSFPDNYQYTNLLLPAGFIKISEYDYSISQGQFTSGQPLAIQGTKGSYVISLDSSSAGRGPTVSITLNGKTVVEKSLQEWLNGLEVKYEGSSGKEIGNVKYEDMLIKIEQGSLRVLLVFDQISIQTRSNAQEKIYTLHISGIYLAE